VAKADQEIAINPVDHPERRLRYGSATGRFEGSDHEASRDIEDTLNLNAAHLCEARKMAVHGAQQALARRRGGKAFTRRQLERERNKWLAGREAFSGAVVAWLDTRLARMSA
jgi:hypothetical protein